MRKVSLRVLFYVLVIMMLLGCKMYTYRPHSQLRSVKGEPMLLGALVYEDILFYFDNWREQHDQSQVEPDVVTQLKDIRDPVEILCFLGTWCSDSRKGVPPFMKALQAAQNPHILVKLIGVDRDKIDPDLLATEYEVQSVPTFIILKSGKEVARMVEYPEKTFAEDLLDILHPAG